MTARRVHIFGASGTGTSTLGRAVAEAWSVPFHDTDDYFWHPTEPPYTQPRPKPERLALMQAMFLPRRTWVLSGSLMGWGEPVLPLLDLAVFLTLDPTTRLHRLRQREANRFGPAAVASGGPYHAQFDAFLAWAAQYDHDDPAFKGRNLTRHRAFLTTLPCPVLELDAALPVPDLVRCVLDACHSKNIDDFALTLQAGSSTSPPSG